MSIIANVTLFFLSLFDPFTLGNAFSRFQYLNDADNKNINIASELNSLVRFLQQMNNQNPLRLVEIVKESHCPSFNHILYMVRKGLFKNMHRNQIRDSLRFFKKTFYSESFSSSIIHEAIKILENLKLSMEDQRKMKYPLKSCAIW
jgi:hypothetical protein